ncbi:MAG: methyltransferase, partial [Anaerolineae bacterium]|nr:methyltransferase [Anaerolineae bacterium]
VLDLYSGVGLFTAFIAQHAHYVTAIESSPTAVQDAKVNLAAFKNVELLEGRAEDILKRQKYHAAVTDPPRTGMKSKALKTLIQCRPQKIIYVSCDPSTLARDARRLAESGYRLTVVQPVDMFPQTYHIETVAVFS